MKINDFNDLLAYGTSEGVTKAWDTRGRGKKWLEESDLGGRKIPPVPKKYLPQKAMKMTPQNLRNMWKQYNDVGEKINKAARKLESPQETHGLFSGFLHMLRQLGEWHDAVHNVRDLILESSAAVWAISKLVDLHYSSAMASLTNIHIGLHPIMLSLAPMLPHIFHGAGASSQYGQTGWQYGRRQEAPAAGYVPARDLAGFPRSGGSGHGGRMRTPQIATPKGPSTPLGKGTAMGKTFRPPRLPKMPKPVVPKLTKALPMRAPNPSIPKLPSFHPGTGFRKTLAGESDSQMGAFGHGHIDPLVWFHPPSLTKRIPNEETRIPTDDVREKNNKFGDVTKRESKDTQRQRADLLKRKTPGGSPPYIPVRTTLVSPHSAVYMPGMESAAENRRNKRVRSGKGMFTSYSRRGCI